MARRQSRLLPLLAPKNVAGNSQRAKPLAVCAFRSLFYERYQAENE